MINGFDSLIVTKLDVLDELDEIPVCVAYKLDGRVIDEMPARNIDLERVEPVLERRKGWKASTQRNLEVRRVTGSGPILSGFPARANRSRNRLHLNRPGAHGNNGPSRLQTRSNYCPNNL